MLTRTLPIRDPDFDPEQERISSFMKEFHTSQREGRPSVLDYSVWFSEDPNDINRPLSPFLAPCPAINHRIRACLHSFREAVRKLPILLPQITGKRSVSRSTASLYCESFQPPVPFDKEILPRDLERRYADTGQMVDGYSELRQVWTYGDLKPRTYFAFGGDAFHASKYVREVMNLLANSFLETGFKSRFSYHDVLLSPSKRLFTYDYKTFTTNLAEHKYFLYALGDFMKDVEIEALDTNRGIEYVNVGEMITEYARRTTDEPEFTINRLCPEEDFTTYIHNVAGFLGVYGNIASATSLHGMHAAQICGPSTNSKCVGDDVLASGEKEPFPMEFKDSVRAIQSLGDIEETKVQVWEDDHMEVENDKDSQQGWHYTKRPIDRIGNSIVVGLLLEFPMYGALAPEEDGIHSSGKDLKERIKAAATQTFHLIRKVRDILIDDIQEEDIEFILQSMVPVYACFGIPSHGSLPHEYVHGFKGNLFLPINRSIFFEPLESLSIGSFDPSQPISIPVTVRSLNDVVVPPHYPGLEYTYVADRFHRFMSNMGYIDIVPLFEEALIEYTDYLRRIEALITHDVDWLCSVVVHEVPDWCHDLQGRLLPL